MYRVGQRARNRRKRIAWITAVVLFLVLVVVLGAVFGKRFLHSDTLIHQSATVVTPTKVSAGATQSFDAGIFTLQLPSGWKQIAGEKQPYDIYRWETGTNSSDSQLLEVYQDTIPQNFAVNRVLPVQSNGAQVTVLGSVSDNCSDFTKAATSVATSGGTLAKWTGINFLCDLNNYERDVVGTSSQNAINAVSISGPASGSHEFFFTYTDHSINPEYSAFYSALASFRLK